MADYTPPSENLPIFDPLLFTQGEDFITQNKADKRYLRYPNAQGTEYFNEMYANTIKATTDLSLNPTGIINCNGKAIDTSGGEIRNCPLVYSQNNNNITIEGKGTGDVILKTNNTAGLTVTDTSSINVEYPITMNSDLALRRSVQTSAVNFSNAGVTPFNSTTRSQIFNSGNTLAILNLNNGGNTQIQVKDSGGGDTTPLNLTSTTCNFTRPINMTDATSANRNITGSLVGLTENTGTYNSTLLGQIYQTSATQYHQNLATSGAINMVVKDSGGTNITPLQLTSSSLNIASNVNVSMPAGTGIINQSNTTGVNTVSNALKRTQIAISSNSPTGSSISGLEVYDDVNGKGCFIMPNTGSGTLGDTTRTNDCAIVSRSPQNTNAITIANWNTNLRNGLRVFTTDVNNCGLTLQCGQNSTADYTELAMNYNRTTNTTTTTFNNSINFNPSGTVIPSRRILNGIGTVGLTDILGNVAGGTNTANIYLDSTLTVPGVVYDNNLNGGYHIFSTNDAGGVKTSPIYYGSALTSVSNTFIVRSAVTPSNRFDMLTDASNNTNLRARSTTASTNALININCDTVSAGGITTNNAVATIAPTYYQFMRPIQLSYNTIPSAMNQIGYQTTTTMSSVVVASSASIRNITSYTFADAGTYMVNWGIYGAVNTGTATFTNLQFAIANAATNSFDSYTFTYPSYLNLVRDYPTLSSTDQAINVNTSCVYRATTGGKLAYFNYLAEYTGGINITLGGVYTITRIG